MTQPQPFDFRAFHAKFKLAMIVACSENGVIGRDGDLPWHLPIDLRHFMRSTKNCPVIMGRKTFDSLDRPLPDRLNIVVSRSMPDPGQTGVVVCRDLEGAIEQGRRAICEDRQDRPIWIGGGGTIYKAVMDRADLVVRTLIEAKVEGDASFPMMDPQHWALSHAERHEADERHDYAFRIEWWARRPG